MTNIFVRHIWPNISLGHSLSKAYLYYWIAHCFRTRFTIHTHEKFDEEWSKLGLDVLK